MDRGRNFILAAFITVFVFAAITASSTRQWENNVAQHVSRLATASPSQHHAEAQFDNGGYDYKVVWANSSGVLAYQVDQDVVRRLVWYNPAGSVITNHTIPVTYPDVFNDVCSDGTFIYATGYRDTPPNINAILFKLTLQGGIVWNRTYQFPFWTETTNEVGISVWAAGGRIFTAIETSYTALGTAHVVTWTQAGDITWEKWGVFYPNYSQSRGVAIWGNTTHVVWAGDYTLDSRMGGRIAILSASDGSYLAVGNTSYLSEIICVDKFYDMAVDDSGIYVCGSLNDSTTINDDMLVMKWAFNGSLVWNRTLMALGQDKASSIRVENGMIYVCGTLSYGGPWHVLAAWDASGDFKWYTARASLYPIDTIWSSGSTIYTGGKNLTRWQEPAITRPLDKMVTPGSTGNFITWTIVDSSITSPTYNITRNGTLVVADTWVNNTPVSVNVSGLAIGKYEFKITALDGLGGRIEDTVLLFVNENPQVTHPSNITYAHSTTDHHINWTITDASILKTRYDIYRNGLWNASSSWSNGSLIVHDIDGLPVGQHNVTIVATDGMLGRVQDTVWVNVTNVAPSISTPPNATYMRGTMNNNVQWTVTDASTTSRTYTASRNGTQFASGVWNSGQPFNVSIDELAFGIYNVSIIAFDGYGGMVTDWVKVTVTNAPPTLSGSTSASVTFANGQSMSFCTITDADIATTSYTIYRNGTSIAAGNWTSGQPISCLLDMLLIGSNNVTVIASDGMGGSIQRQVIVRMTNQAPAIGSLGESGRTSGFDRYTSFHFTIQDAGTGSGASYTVLVDGSPYQTGSWTTDVAIVVPYDRMSTGSHVLTIIVSDGLGATNQRTYNVDVQPDLITPIVLSSILAGGGILAVVLFVRMKRRRAPPKNPSPSSSVALPAGGPRSQKPKTGASKEEEEWDKGYLD